MTQDSTTSYFFQNQPATKKKSTSGLLNRRQQNASYLQQLELPSLPPLSQMLTDKTDENKVNNNNSKNEKVGKSNDTSDNTNTMTTVNTRNSPPPPAAAPSVASNTAAQGGVIPTYPPAATQVPSQPMYFGDYTLNGDPLQPPQQQHQNTNLQRNLVVPNPVVSSMNNPTVNGNMLMDGSFAPNMMPLDSMYPMSHPSGLSTDPATAAAMVAASAAAAGYMKYDEGVGNQRIRQPSSSSTSSTDKIYSFVAIPGTNQKKRPRRRYDEIERLYHCNWPGCTKAYGTLNHLNAHVSMQKHGPKRHPAEFKEMRKEWRRQKKDREASKKAAEEAIKQQQHLMQVQQPPAPFTQQAFQPAVYGQIPTGSMPLTGFY